METSTRRLIASAVLLGTIGCSRGDPSREKSSTTDARLSAIEQKIADGELKLQAVRRDLAEEEAKVVAARAEAEFQGCRAKVAEIRAEAGRRRADCLLALATNRVCLAQVARDGGEAAVVGCLLGIGAAAISGGAATPIALTGCAAGVAAGEVYADECPLPACAKTLEKTDDAVLAERGLTSLPRCGGWLGVELATSFGPKAGVAVRAAGQGTSAASAGVLAGDLIVAVHGRPVTAVEDIGPILRKVKTGTSFRIGVIRGDRRLELVARAAGRDSQGKETSKTVLGVEIESMPTARFTRGVTVKSVAAGSPAAEGSLHAGELLTEVVVPASSGRAAKRVAIGQPTDLEVALDELRPGDEVSLVSVVGERSRSVTFRLGKREGHAEL